MGVAHIGLSNFDRWEFETALLGPGDELFKPLKSKFRVLHFFSIVIFN